MAKGKLNAKKGRGKFIPRKASATLQPAGPGTNGVAHGKKLITI